MGPRHEEHLSCSLVSCACMVCLRVPFINRIIHVKTLDMKTHDPHTQAHTGSSGRTIPTWQPKTLKSLMSLAACNPATLLGLSLEI